MNTEINPLDMKYPAAEGSWKVNMAQEMNDHLSAVNHDICHGWSAFPIINIMLKVDLAP